MVWWSPTDWVGQSLDKLLLHTVVPIVLWFFALGVMLFAPFGLKWKLLIAVILAVVGAVLWGLIPIPGVS
jgi:uncharacterized membrane-anchored protein